MPPVESSRSLVGVQCHTGTPMPATQAIGRVTCAKRSLGIRDFSSEGAFLGRRPDGAVDRMMRVRDAECSPRWPGNLC